MGADSWLQTRGPTIWVSIDVENIPDAIEIAQRASTFGAHWLEAGSGLIASVGVEAIRALASAFKDSTIVADFKTMDGGGYFVELAARAGAHAVTVMAASEDSTIISAVEAAHRYSVRVIADTLGVKDKAKRAAEVQELGVHAVLVHTGFDERRRGTSKSPLLELPAVLDSVRVPVAIGGGITSEVAKEAVRMGVHIILVSTTTGTVPFESVIKSVHKSC